MIRVEQLNKSYAGRAVLSGVDLQQAAGESVVLIGASGCGKTTFLRCLNHLESADAGRITVGDVTIEGGRVPDAECQRQLRLRAGMVFQQFHLFQHRTALENIMEGPRYVLGRPATEAEELARGLLAKVGLERQADQYPGQL